LIYQKENKSHEKGREPCVAHTMFFVKNAEKNWPGGRDSEIIFSTKTNGNATASSGARQLALGQELEKS